MTKKTEEGNEYKKGLWTVEEDSILMDYVKAHGKGQWNRIAKKTGLKRCGKSCRLRWMNYLSPNVKKGDFTEQEEDLIVRLHKLLGNRWSLIAKRVPGRTDNQVKNHWNTHLSKKLGIKDQSPKSSDCGTNILANSTDASGDKIIITSGSNPSGSGTSEIITVEKTQNKGTDQLFLDNQSVPVIEEGSFMKSFWVHDEDDFEWSTITSMMDFMDGYCF